MRAQRMQRVGGWIVLGALGVALGAAGCQEEFDPLEQVQGLRVLAFGPDKPALLPEETASMSALVAADEDAELSYVWEWCPFSAGAVSGYECGLDQAQLDELLAQSPIPAEAPNLLFGGGPSPELPYPLPAPLLQGVCAQLQSQELPEFVELPDCEASFPITLRLTVADNTGNSVVAVKTLRLLYGPPQGEDVNVNPLMDAVRISPNKVSRDEAELLEPGVPFPVKRDQTYNIFIDVAPEQAQTFTPLPSEDDPAPEPRLETLQAQWFFQGGAFEFDETIFIEDFVGFDVLTNNKFTAPKTRDYEAEELKIYILLRDNRGGISWAERVLKLE